MQWPKEKRQKDKQSSTIILNRKLKFEQQELKNDK
jgi:hypothetical protein